MADQLPETGEPGELRAPPEPETDAEWLFGNTPYGLRLRAAHELAAEFGVDVDEFLV
jgi:hypothetical protein